MKRGFLAPYKGARYHILNFQQGEELHRLEEKFNLSPFLTSFGHRTNFWSLEE